MQKTLHAMRMLEVFSGTNFAAFLSTLRPGGRIASYSESGIHIDARIQGLNLNQIYLR